MLFFSYSHKDEQLRNELEKHLAPLKRQGIIDSWHDRRILAGSDLDRTISSELEAARIILLLISVDFLASDYCHDIELVRALEKHESGEAVVIPVILRSCDWETSAFGRLRATPPDGKPVTKFADIDEAFTLVAKDIRQVAQAFSQPPTEDAVAEQIEATHGQTPPERSSNLRVKRTFNDHERDDFLENTFEYIARFFDGSLDELAKRNDHISVRFKRKDATGFTAALYDYGNLVSQCGVWYGGTAMTRDTIYYSSDGEVHHGRYNELLSVVDNGYALLLKPMGMPMFGATGRDVLLPQGAAEYLWSLLLRSLQY